MDFVDKGCLNNVQDKLVHRELNLQTKNCETCACFYNILTLFSSPQHTFYIRLIFFLYLLNI